MTVADQAMHLAVREVEELNRVANPITPESLSTQHRVFECHGERGMVGALGLAFAAASELGAFDRRQVPVRLPFKQVRPAFQALAARPAHARVNIGLKRYLLQTLARGIRAFRTGMREDEASQTAGEQLVEAHPADQQRG